MTFIYRCRQCKAIQETPLWQWDGFDEEIYESCRYCGGRVSKEAERCQGCGAELFDGDLAYEIGENVYCCDCVTEVMI